MSDESAPSRAEFDDADAEPRARALRAEVERPVPLPSIVLAPPETWEGAGAEVIAVWASGSPVSVDPLGAGVLERYGVEVEGFLRREKVKSTPGSITRVPVTASGSLPRQLLVLGAGSGAAADLRIAGAALARRCLGEPLALAVLPSWPGDSEPSRTPVVVERLRAFVEGLALGGHRPPKAGLSAEVPGPTNWVILGAYASSPDDPMARALKAGLLHAEAGLCARELALAPSNLKTPAWLAGRAQVAARLHSLATQVWSVRELEAEGFGALLAVGGGSAAAPRLVRIDYRPSLAQGADQRPVVLVGKGITYDTGGLAIKPGDAMVPMKTDMTGAGSVLAALLACGRAGVKVPVTGLLALAENAVGADSYRPGDVVRPYRGPSVEINNTDAEGRLVLADALSYAVAHLEPRLLVDLATLTGAASLGLGRRHAALFTQDEAQAQRFSRAAEASGERVWRMPLVEDYRPAIDSEVADLTQVSRLPHVSAGSIVAALFLREYTGSVPWVHLDIAGPARSDSREHEVPKGATGFGARLLLRWLEALD